MKKIFFCTLVVCLVLSLLFINISAQKTSSKSQIQSDLKKLQTLFSDRDYESGYESGKELGKKYPESLEIKSWTLINGSRGDISKASLAESEKFIKEKGENYWTLLALTYNQSYQDPAKSIATAEKLIKFDPNDEEAIIAYNSAVFQNRKYQESLDWLNKNETNLQDKSRFLVAKAISTYLVEDGKKGNVQLAFDLFKEALKITPNSVNANYLYANYLNRNKKTAEALAFYKKATELAPHIASVRSGYWQALKSQANKSDDEKEAELVISIDNYLKQSKKSPAALLAAWNEYQDLTGWHNTAKPKHIQKKEQLEKQIKQTYPNTKYDEEVDVIIIRRVYGKYFGKDEGAKILELNNKPKSKRTADEVKFLEEYDKKRKVYKAEEIKLQRAYLKRSQHFDKEKLGQVSYALLQNIAADKDSSEEEITALVKGTLDNYKNYFGNLNTDIASLLVRRREEQPNSIIAKDAKKYARIGLEEADKKVAALSKDAKKIEIQELQLTPLNILATALIADNNYQEAEKLLAKIEQLLENSDSSDFRIESAKYSLDINRASLFTGQADWEKAENLYVKISYDNTFGKKTFEKFYEKRFSKKEGFDEYYSEIQKRLKARAKERMAEVRIKNPQEAIPFSLKNTEDKIISLADLKGKIIVINVWGIWCSPCVAEMNELQELSDKYKDDKDVSVLTIDQGDEVADIKKFMSNRKLNLPVLMNDTYLDKVPYFKNAFPTTFFIDKNGKVAYIKTGNSGNLVEEFSWRIDILKEDK